MAFVARTSRSNAPAERGYRTSNHVGPGSYDSESTRPKWSKKPSYAPFSSTSARVTLAQPAQTKFNPGPGAYGQRRPRHFRTQSFASSFKSHTKRFNKSNRKKQTPGPGAYALKQKWVRRTHVEPRGRQEQNQAITWKKAPSAPSIPGGTEQYGYEESSDGNLVKQKPPTAGHSGVMGDTVGPGDYSPNQERTNKHRRPKAVLSFRLSQTQRTNFTNNRAPGPGSYSVPKKPAGVSSLLMKKANAAFQSRTGRTNLVGAGAGAPGPGTYENKKAFRPGDDVPQHLQFFGSTSKRFDRNSLSAAASLGPGSYNMNVSSFSAKKRHMPHQTIGFVGFSSTTSRFAETDVDLQGPGPAAYTRVGFAKKMTEDPSGNSARKSAAGLDTPFGSSTRRFTASKAAAQAPGPGAYRNEFISLESKRTSDKSSSAFASRSSRMMKKKLLNTPDPGHYNTTRRWRSGNRATGLLGYGAGSRFSDDSTLTPGPGTYKSKPGSMHLNESPVNRKKVMVSVEPRFRERKVDKTPGPGNYDGEKLYGNLVTRTFNMSIAEEMYT